MVTMDRCPSPWPCPSVGRCGTKAGSGYLFLGVGGRDGLAVALAAWLLPLKPVPKLREWIIARCGWNASEMRRLWRRSGRQERRAGVGNPARGAGRGGGNLVLGAAGRCDALAIGRGEFLRRSRNTGSRCLVGALLRPWCGSIAARSAAVSAACGRDARVP
jgi:hypothetical protein